MTYKILGKSFVASAIILGAMALQPVHAFEADKDITLLPGNGMSFAVGSKRALAFFNKNAGQCDVTIMVSEQNSVVGEKYRSASRVKVQLVPGNSTQLDSSEGKSLKVICNQNAKSMTIKNQKLEVSALTQ